MSTTSKRDETEILAFLGTVVQQGCCRPGMLAGSGRTPWGGPEACIDAYEDRARASAELQLNVARALDFEPVRSFAATYMDMTRDVVAAQVSSARWLFDV